MFHLYFFVNLGPFEFEKIVANHWVAISYKAFAQLLGWCFHLAIGRIVKLVNALNDVKQKMRTVILFT